MRSSMLAANIRDYFIFESAEEQDWYVCDLWQSRFRRPDLVTERSEESGGRKGTRKESVNT